MFFDFAVAEWEAAATTTSKWQQQGGGVSGVVLRTPAQVSFLYRAPRRIALNSCVLAAAAAIASHVYAH